MSSDHIDQTQSHFDDLYTVVYALIDDTKARYRVVKLYKGSHGSPDPHPVVLDYGEFFAAHRRGVLGYACDRVRPGADYHRVTDLEEFDRCACSRVPTREVFNLLARTGRRDGETADDYLTYLATRRHRLGGYRGGSSGYDEESRAFAAAYFQAPVGYYQSLRLIPTILGGALDVAMTLDGDTVGEWLANTRGHGGRIGYVPLVNNADGRMLSRTRACLITGRILNCEPGLSGQGAWSIRNEVRLPIG